MRRPSTLIRRETYLPGWSATVGGSGAPLHAVEDLFQAVPVPAGTHTVRFSYAPPLIVWGWVAFAAGLIALGLSLIRPAHGRAGPPDDVRAHPTRAATATFVRR